MTKKRLVELFETMPNKENNVVNTEQLQPIEPLPVSKMLINFSYFEEYWNSDDCELKKRIEKNRQKTLIDCYNSFKHVYVNNYSKICLCLNDYNDVSVRKSIFFSLRMQWAEARNDDKAYSYWSKMNENMFQKIAEECPK
jgi:hypothetical protein